MTEEAHTKAYLWQHIIAFARRRRSSSRERVVRIDYVEN
jgi:hypothetical protein